MATEPTHQDENPSAQQNSASDGPTQWKVTGPFLEQFDPEKSLKPDETQSGSAADFDRSLVSILNVAYENGYLHPESVEQMGSLFRDSHNIWLSDRAPGSTWADTLFPTLGKPGSTKPGLPETVRFHAAGGMLILAQVGDGRIMAQAGPDERSIGEFVQQETVLVELGVDLLTMVFAAFGMPAKSGKLAEKFATFLRTHPNLASMLQRLLSKLIFSTKRSFAELARDLAEFFEALWIGGFFVEVGKDLLEDWDWWDWLVFILGLVAMLTPAGGAATGAKVAYIAAQFANMLVELWQKWERFQRGEPLGQGLFGGGR